MLFSYWFDTKKQNEQPREKTIWFKSKWYGWGWYPVAWQGWSVLGAYVGLVAFVLSTSHLYEGVKQIFSNVVLTIVILTGFLIYICYKKGEKPVWRWGKEPHKKTPPESVSSHKQE